MSDTGYRRPGATATATPSVGGIAGIATLLVAVNVALMLAISYTPLAAVGQALFSNFLIGIVVFGLSVGGGYWLATKGLDRGSWLLAGSGVTLTQAGYAFIGAAILAFAEPALRAPAVAIAAVVTGIVTAVITVYVFNTSRSFRGWQKYAGGLFIGGIAVGVAGYFLYPPLVALAGVLFLLGFVVDLVYEVWAVRESRYSTLRSAIGVYVAVMGVFIHVLQWVLRALAIADA